MSQNGCYVVFSEDKKDQLQGIVVFYELDQSASHLVLNQMDRSFKSTLKGKTRSTLIIPESFFVHSDLTTGIQIVDFIAYIISWDFRAGKLDKECREELNALNSNFNVVIGDNGTGKSTLLQWGVRYLARQPIRRPA